MTAQVSAAYAQLLSLGVLWIGIHCAGMCGPVLVGLDVAGTGRGHSIGQGTLQLLSYQAGRATTYATLGALAGWIGVGLTAVLGPVGALLTGLFGLGLIMWAAAPVLKGLAKPAAPADSGGQRIALNKLSISRQQHSPSMTADFLGRFVPQVAGTSPSLGRRYLLGAVMGLLPCMITFWVLGLAALTGSPLHGAMLMVILVLMTTPMLLGVTLLPRLVRWHGGERFRRGLLAVSGAWLVMIALASVELIPHAHLPVGDSYVLMLW